MVFPSIWLIVKFTVFYIGSYVKIYFYIVPTVPTVPTVIPGVVLTPPAVPAVTPSAAPVPAVTTAPGTVPAAAGQAEIVHLTVAAISSGNPATMTALADELDRRGYPVEVAALRAAAAEQRMAPQPTLAADVVAITQNALLLRQPDQMSAAGTALGAKGYTRERAALLAGASVLGAGTAQAGASKDSAGDALMIGAVALAALKALAVI